jgi:hypothetical protein
MSKTWRPITQEEAYGYMLYKFKPITYQMDINPFVRQGEDDQCHEIESQYIASTDIIVDLVKNLNLKDEECGENS